MLGSELRRDEKFKILDEFLGHVVMLVTRAMFNRLT